jgi:hypothetical protein
MEALPDDTLARIRRASNSNTAFGAQDFVDDVATKAGRPSGFRRRGRPRVTGEQLSKKVL